MNLSLLIEINKIKEFNTSEIIFLDVNQGDAILLKSKGLVGLIDVGANNFISTRLSATLPVSLSKLDFVLLTHFDKDHIEGFLRISKSYQIDKVLITKSNKSNNLTNEILKVIETKKIPTYYIDADSDFKVGEFYVNVVWPNSKNENLAKDSNDLSIVLEISKGDCNVFTGGDLSFKFEEMTLENISDHDFEILKAGHHGSKTSSSEKFINSITPEVAIISAGKDNKYGHPHKVVMDLFKSKNIYTFETKNSDIITRFELTNIINLKQGENKIQLNCF